MIYLDYAATCPPYMLTVLRSVTFYKKYFGNPSSLYKIGSDSADEINHAREEISKILGAQNGGIYFTSGGSESNAWALESVLRPGDHLITTEIEHSSILMKAKALEAEGVEVTYIKPDSNGFVSLSDIIKAKKDNTALVSVMLINNELGTIQPVKEIAAWAKENGIFVHTDAVQAVGHIKIDLEDLGVDMLSASAHKFGGPRGIGLLYASDCVSTWMRPLIYGKQEGGMRGGTENTVGILMMRDALKYMDTVLYLHFVKTKANVLLDKLLSIKGVHSNRPTDVTAMVAPWIINIRVDGVDAESLIMALSEHEIYISAGSACNAQSTELSHVLKAIGLTSEQARNSIRISLGQDSTEKELNEFVEIFKQTVKQLRE